MIESKKSANEKIIGKQKKNGTQKNSVHKQKSANV